jgi:hypothetical protein
MMVKSLKAALFANALLSVTVFTPTAALANQTNSASSSPSACQDLLIVMKDDSVDPNSQNAANQKKITAYLDCHEANGNTPSGTTMNFFIFDQGRLCHGYRVCGNLRGWEGAFRVGATWYFGQSFADAFDLADNCSKEDTSCRSFDHPFGGYGFPAAGYPGYGYGYPYGASGRSNVRLDFVTKFSNIDRHCGALHNYECLELPTLPPPPAPRK